MYPVVAAVRLTFLLPTAILRQTGFRGPFVPVDGCGLEVARTGMVVVEGPSRERVQELARRYLRIIARAVIAGEQPPVSIAAVMKTYSRDGGPGRDSYQIIIGADIAFAATGMAADLPSAGEGTPPDAQRQPGRRRTQRPLAGLLDR